MLSHCFLMTTFSAKPCPTGWRKYEGSCYYTSTGKKTWSKGREYCQSKGADLAIVKSQEEMVCLSLCIYLHYIGMTLHAGVTMKTQ